MFVQALAEYADSELSDQLTDEAWESKPVAYLVELDGNGRFLSAIPRFVEAVRGKKNVSVPEMLDVPRSPVARNDPFNSYPLLAVDDIQYVLGPGAWTKQGTEEKETRRHEAFAQLVKKAAEETGDEALQACARFYEQAEQVEAARKALAEAKSGTSIALSVGGPVVKRKAVREYWRDHYRTASQRQVSSGGDGECLISGRVGPIARTHPKIKGTAGVGGRAEVSLMSFDKEAFCSYGWEQNANSPVAPDRAMAYVLALNDLLKSDNKHRRNLAGIAFIFWTKQFTDDDVMAMLVDADQVDRLLQFDWRANPDPNMFYLAGVTGNGARLVIRYWVAEALHNVKANLRDWFEGLRVADAYTGETVKPPGLWRVLRTIHRDEKFVDHRVVAVMRRAVEGRAQPFGHQMLATVLNRLRISAAGRLDAVRIGLVRLCVNDLLQSEKGEVEMQETLDVENRNKAYLCGRLMAIYDALQWTAYKRADGTEVNTTVVDRYYSLAMTDPAMAFQKLDVLAQKHLRKLRRPDLRGIEISFSRRIDEICNAIGAKFPDQLDLRDQGRFVLGFHHQRAQQREQAQEYKSRAAAESADSE